MIMIKADQFSGTKKNPLIIGHKGEHLTRTVVFDLQDFIRELGEGTWAVAIMRPNETISYIAQNVWQVDETHAGWDVSNIDTSFDGYGKVELRFYPNGNPENDICKTKVWITKVEWSIGNEGEVPKEVPDLVEQAHMYAENAKSSAIKAESDAAAAAASANLAKQYRDEAFQTTPKGYEELYKMVVSLKDDLTNLGLFVDAEGYVCQKIEGDE